jgi:hypothetical protein
LRFTASAVPKNRLAAMIPSTFPCAAASKRLAGTAARAVASVESSAAFPSFFVVSPSASAGAAARRVRIDAL